MKIIYADKPIGEFTHRLDRNLVQRIDQMIIKLGVHGYELRMPHSKPLGDGLFELRVLGKTQIRIIYAFHDGQVLLLRIFKKKLWTVPRREIKHAMDVWKNYLA